MTKIAFKLECDFKRFFVNLFNRSIDNGMVVAPGNVETGSAVEYIYKEGLKINEVWASPGARCTISTIPKCCSGIRN